MKGDDSRKDKAAWEQIIRDWFDTYGEGKNEKKKEDKNSMRKFWKWAKDEQSETRTLFLDGEIAEESWFDDEVTPKIFRDELFAGSGDVTVWINSPGGDCVAASQIYTMMTDYKGNITVKIDGMAASAASVIAMAGSKVLMSPTSIMMIHNPLTVAIGDSEEMKKAIAMLGEFKESIINAYEKKSGQPRDKISRLMDAETWMNANKAIELGFADGMIEDEKGRPDDADASLSFAFSRRAATNSLVAKAMKKVTPTPPAPAGVDAETLYKRLDLILH